MASRGSDDARELELQRSKVSTLEQLLEVYEASVVEQSEKLLAEQERIRFQKTLLESQGEAALDGILSVSTDGTVLFANRHLAEMFGMAPAEVEAISADALLRAMAARSADPIAFEHGVADLAGGEESREEFRLADGRTFDRFTAPIIGPQGALLGRIWHFRDISAVKELGRMKDEFVSAVSHELRTPLTSIRGALDLIASGTTSSLPPETKDLLEIARGNSERLARLVDDVLDIEKIEAGRMELRMQSLELEPLVRQAIASMEPYGEPMGVSFALAGAAAGARVVADPDRLTQVLQNLLSNAAKFSPVGGTVQVAIERRGRRLRVSVCDRGPGIPREFRGRIFQKFAQAASGPTPRQKSGTGLGLNIARAIVERLGGSIGFHSVVGAGSTFHFELPEQGSGAAEGPRERAAG